MSLRTTVLIKLLAVPPGEHLRGERVQRQKTSCGLNSNFKRLEGENKTEFKKLDNT